MEFENISLKEGIKLSKDKKHYILMDVRCLGIDDQFVEHGSVSELRRMLKIDGESIADSIRQWMKE
jgi:deoxyxylulose-5-phosphate synthase